MIGEHPLSPWEKVAIIFLGGSLIGLTLLLVVCSVCPTCLFYRLLNPGMIYEIFQGFLLDI